MKIFLKLAADDAELTARLNDMDKDAIIAAAQQRGIALTEADFAADKSAELSEDELNEVAGGGKRACVMGGGGKEGENCKPCARWLGGNSDFSDGVGRCSCSGAGGGADY